MKTLNLHVKMNAEERRMLRQLAELDGATDSYTVRHLVREAFRARMGAAAAAVSNQ